MHLHNQMNMIGHPIERESFTLEFCDLSANAAKNGALETLFNKRLASPCGPDKMMVILNF